MKKKRRIIMCMLIGMLIISNIVYAEQIERVEYPVLLNQTGVIEFKKPLFTINDSLYVPLRELSEQLGIGIEWNEGKKQVELKIETEEKMNERRGTKENPIYVSIINLIATPYKYHNQYVSFTGVGNIEFEGNKVYLSKEDWEYVNTKNAIALKVKNDFCVPLEEAKQLNGQYVFVEGRFNAEYKGHLSGCSGGLEDVSSYYKEMSRADYEELNEMSRE